MIITKYMVGKCGFRASDTTVPRASFSTTCAYGGSSAQQALLLNFA